MTDEQIPCHNHHTIPIQVAVPPSLPPCEEFGSETGFHKSITDVDLPMIEDSLVVEERKKLKKTRQSFTLHRESIEFN